MSQSADKVSKLVGRISISLDQDLLAELDSMVQQRGYESRSQAIGDMVNHQLIDHKQQLGNSVMAGTIALFYERHTRGLQQRLADLQYRHIDAVISSLHVHLAEDKIMEVLLVQGPARKLQAIADSMSIMKGVITCRLQLMAAVMPPIISADGSTNQYGEASHLAARAV
ncbi:MAG: nickel-responsive transcriptional regulator NikR [Burkholderiaceae bacterium]|nr:nickel-responsive transcriptional regulator NikR [Burkholderiaceae bacterium]